MRRRTGLDLGRANALISSAASFMLGIRADGVETSRFRRDALAEGRGAGRRDGWELYDFGPVSSIPYGTAAEAFRAVGPRIALRGGALVAARRDQSRRDLIGVGASPLEDPIAALAVACLGDVVAARVVPNNFTHWPNSGPELLAFGVRPRERGRPREVLCAADPSRARAEDAALAMEDAFAPGAIDAVTGEPISETIERTEVELVEGDAAGAARAELQLTPGTEPGFLFGAFVRGSTVTYVGLRAPEPVSR